MPEDSKKDDAGREIAVFTEAIRVPLEDRPAFLENACCGDENLRRKVEGLLRAHDRIGDFLEEPPTGTSLE
jgi:eukaryotic-like serine/threonine-protein kinase